VSGTKCLADLRTFGDQLRKDGYWLNESGYGYGYPMYGYGYGYGMPADGPQLVPGANSSTGGYWRARPGYEVRTLLTSANILAQSGQQQACETLLSSIRVIYQGYVKDLRSGDTPRTVREGGRAAEIAAAQPVDGSNISFRSDDLIGTEVVNPKNEELGSVNDIVLTPKTGKIAYLVLARGGLFGIDVKYVPIPWGDFKATPGTNLLVLDSVRARMDAAPEVKEGGFSKGGEYAMQSQKIDDFWQANLGK
jgi:sporulation protein YlmC with PRC-barrel domain